jgi:L-fucose isomerase-like protein
MARVIVIPTARPTFAVDVARHRAVQARALLEELGATVAGPAELVMSPEDLTEAQRFLDPGADLVVNVCASFSDATPALTLYRDLDRPVLLWSFREPGPVGDRLWLNSLCGANLFGHALVRLGGQVRLVYGDPDEPAVRETLREALAGRLPDVPPQPDHRGERGDTEHARQGLETLRGQRIGVLGDAPPGFTPSEYDPALLHRLFGLEVDELTVDSAFQRIESVDARDRDAELAAVTAARPSVMALNQGEVAGHAAITTALRDWTARDSLAAVAVRCWPEFPVRLGVCPCSSLSRLADEGTPTACERDVYGAVTMLLLEALGAGTTYLVDTVDLDAAANLVRLWHCGSAATSLAADPDQATQDVHCNRRIGVAGNFGLKTGPVIMARLTENPGGGLRLLLASGESLPAVNRFQGNTADVRLDADATAFVHGLVTGGFPHHTVLAWNDVRPALRTAADLLDIPVIEW